MKKISSFFMVLALAAFTIPSVVHATFILDPNPTIQPGTFLFLNSAQDVTAFTGNVGTNNTGPVVNIQTNSAVNVVGGGFATIQAVNGTLNSLVFTPGDSTQYGDFSFRGQLSTDGNVFLTIVDQINEVFTFEVTNLLANQNFSRIGIISNDGEWLTSATISTDTFFNEVKQIEFSLQQTPAPVPEPGTILLLGTGLLGLGIYSKRRRSS